MSSEAFVPISVTEFQKAYATVLHVLSGTLELAPGTLRMVAATEDQSRRGQDTLVNRAWYVGGLRFSSSAERASFYWRVANVLPLTQDKKYRKYLGSEPLSLHIALLTAVCSVRGSARMTKKVLRAAFDMEFRSQLARVIDGENRRIPKPN